MPETRKNKPMNKIREKQEEILKTFRKDFVQSHNKGEERFLRGLFIEDFEAWLSHALQEMADTAREQTADEYEQAIEASFYDLKPSVNSHEYVQRTRRRIIHLRIEMGVDQLKAQNGDDRGK